MADNAPFHLQLFGPMRLTRADEPLTLPQSKKTRALLAYLALNAREHRRERLCDLFWEMPDDPRAALRWSLSKLRTLLNTPDRQRIVANRETVLLDTSDIAIDVQKIRRNLSTLESLSVDRLEAFAADFSGALLEGLELSRQPEYQAWLVAERGEAETLRTALLESLVERLEQDPSRALPYARDLAARDSHEERRHAVLIRLLKAAGHHQEAEDHHQVAKSLLAEIGQRESATLSAAMTAQATAKPEPVAPAAVRPNGASLHQDIRYCQAADGTNIAYSTVGSGPPLVKAANWLNHLEFEWESPVWRHWIHELSRDHTLIRYDERGNGLSDWDIDELSFDKFVSDLETVVDAAGADRFPLLGISQGTPVAIAYALRHPERVSKLILFGGFGKGWRVRTSPEVVESIEASMVLMRSGWGRDNPAFRQMFTSMFFPETQGDHMVWLNDLQKNTTSPENATRFMRAFGAIDVIDLLPKIDIPTIVLHSRGDAFIPAKAGRRLAQNIPNARFVLLDSNNHLLLEDEPAWGRFVQEVRDFLGNGH